MIERYESKKYVFKEYLPVIVLFIFILSTIINQTIKTWNSEEVILSSTFKEKVINIYGIKGTSYILTTKRINRLSIAKSYNFNYQPSDLNSFLKKGDIIYKNKCSDTLHILRDSVKYHFLIGAGLYNYKSKPFELIQKSSNNRDFIKNKSKCN